MISVDPSTHVIFVPKADLTLVQSTPTEIREMDLNWFRLQLKSWEDSEEGIVQLKTHRHNTEVSVGGLTLARVIEILDPYTVTFEDGQYAVNLSGANSNVGDVVNVNQVSVRSANSAGMTSSPAIEYSSFNGGVTVDQTSSHIGTVFPIGTPQAPVNNLADAMLIANFRGFSTIYIIGDMVIDSSGDYNHMTFIGESMTKSTLTISSGANVENCEFYEATIDGTLDGNAKLKNCRVLTLDYIYGVVEQCMLGPGIIVLGGAEPAHFLDCWSGVAGPATPVIDCGGSGQDLALRNYNGGIKLINKTGPDKVSIDLNSGQVILDSTVTNGEIVIRGVGDLTDNSTATVSSDDLINKDLIALAIWNSDPSNFVSSGSAGETLRFLSFADRVNVCSVHGSPGVDFPLGTSYHPVNNLTDARTIADNASIQRFEIHNEQTLDQSYIGKKFYSKSALATDIIHLNGQDISGTQFEQLKIDGTMVGDNIVFYECLLNGVSGVNGIAANTALNGTIVMGPSGSSFLCTRVNLISDPVIIDMVGAGRVFQGAMAGDLEIRNLVAGSFVSVGMDYGTITLHSSCTGGTAVVAGAAELTDNSTGVTVVNNLNNVENVDIYLSGAHGSGNWEGAGAASNIADAVWDEQRNEHESAGTFGAVAEWSGTGGSLDPDEVASAVWDAIASRYGAPGTMGWLQNLLDNGILSMPKIISGD